MSKSYRYTPDLRVRKPYKREPKLRVNVPTLPFDIEDVDNDEFLIPYTYDTDSENEAEED